MHSPLQAQIKTSFNSNIMEVVGDEILKVRVIEIYNEEVYDH